MRRFCRFFVILILACTVAACESEDTVDYMWVVPLQLNYNINDTFTPNGSLEVYVSYQGKQDEVSLDQVNIRIAVPPKYLPEEQEDVKYDKGYKLEKEGQYLVLVECVGKSTNYFIEVSARGFDIGPPEWED